VEVRGTGDGVIILDAGTGIRRLGGTLEGNYPIHILLSHLHADHIQGLGFFAPLFQPGR
jgi:phosphoribosyl 1,2-cyclic phosphodiesterase